MSPGTPSSTGLSSPRQSPFCPLSRSCSNSDLETVLNKLKAEGLDSDFQKIIDLVKNDKFPLAFSLLRTVSRSLFEQLLESGQNGL
jgi:hypothetical protein